MPVHAAAAQGFARSAAAYERGRPEYPPAAVAWLAQRLRLRTGTTVVDLAAGTGKLSRPLAATGARVVAVEPVAEMRAAIGAGIEAIEGTAEAIPLPDASADAVAVGQAFHWFDGDAALAEIHRVLRPGGVLGLAWNRRRAEDPIHVALSAIMDPHRQGTPALATDAWRAAFTRTRLFGALQLREFASEQSADADLLADRIGSVSFIAALGDEQRAAVLERVRALAADGPVTLRYAAEICACDRIP